MISVVVNGKPEELEAPIALVEFLESKGLAGRRIAVAHNGEVLRKEEYAGATVDEGDRLEIVSPVGGG